LVLIDKNQDIKIDISVIKPDFIFLERQKTIRILEKF